METAKVVPELSEEDKLIKDEIDEAVCSFEKEDEALIRGGLDLLKKLIISSTKSMTSVPKPLKFLGGHYEALKTCYSLLKNDDLKKRCADIVSIVAIVKSDKEEYSTDTLKYRFLGCQDDIETWGHEYIRHLTSQIVQVWQNKETLNEELGTDDISENSTSLVNRCMALVHKIIPYFMKHNAETEAVDLAIELELLNVIGGYCNVNNYDRVCLYMTKMVLYLSDPDNRKLLECAAHIYEKFDDVGNALKCALRLNDAVYTEKLVSSMKNEALQKQLAFLVARQQYRIPYDSLMSKNAGVENSNWEKLADIASNSRLSEYFHVLGRELDIMEPKMPEDVYKSHLEPTRPSLTGGSSNIDSAKQNLASTLVNGLLNCGFGRDKLVMGGGSVSNPQHESRWVYKNKELGMMTAVGTLGWLLLWDVDEGLAQIDRYLYSDDDYVRAGGLLACGVVNCGVRNECDPALALLADYVGGNSKPVLTRAAVMGLGIAYSGTMKQEVLELLRPLIRDKSEDRWEIACLAALSGGLVAVSSMDVDLATAILETMMEHPTPPTPSGKQSATAVSNLAYSRLMALGLGLTVLGRQDEVEVLMASIEAVSEPMRSLAYLMCDICAFAGSGSVLKIQRLLHILSEKAAAPEEEQKDAKKDTKEQPQPEGANATPQEGATTAPAETKYNFLPHQNLAALGVGMISMGGGEPIGQEMGFRVLGRLLRFGEANIKRAVPLALGLMWAGDPQMKVLDTLGKFSHDSDSDIAFCSALAMGIVGAGTNNARLAAMLRQLASFHAKEQNCLLAVRLAQGLLHLGKGTLTLSPLHQDGFLVSPSAVAGLLCVLVSLLDVKKTFMGAGGSSSSGKSGNCDCAMMLYLTPAIQPRLLMTFDEDLNPLPVSVRVGQAVDTVGQAGKPKTITGFQTHTTPVLLAAGERAELSTEEYLPVSKLPLEGFVILKKNPNYEQS